MPSLVFASTGSAAASPSHSTRKPPGVGWLRIHATCVGQSVLGSCQRPETVSAASANSGNASPTITATADT